MRGQDGELRTALIRPLGEDEWERYREIRLRALRQAPHAFSTTAAEAERWPEADWRARLSSRVTFVAEDGGGLIGLVSGIKAEPGPDGGAPGAAELISMWVAPECRGRGVGDQLVEAVAHWAAASGFTRLRLWVAEGNEAAERLYRRGGFRATGERQPLDAGGRVEFAMERGLDARTNSSG